MGMGASRTRERAFAAAGALPRTPVVFEPCQSVPQAGVLLLLPFLQQVGLFSYKEHYGELRSGYYYLDVVILFLALMYLRRIKNPEQLKHHSPGEFGKIMGLDRVPEAKCLRSKLAQLCAQHRSEQWNRGLARQWATGEDNEFYYIDGHVQVYSGYKAVLGKKHVARQKLCLPGIQEFWVNNPEGMPYFYVTGQVNEKLLEALQTRIIPELLAHMPARYSAEQLDQDPELPRFTLVFDREAYSPVFFQKLWQEYRIAIITYRKAVKDQWNEQDFTSHMVSIDGSQTCMELAEKPVTLNGVTLREIRRRSADHQTSVITTNKKLSLQRVAFYMFSRWTQENFFRYMRQDYDFDRMLQYAVEQLDSEIIVNNPAYNKLTYQLKKLREKIDRRKATLFDLQQRNLSDDLDAAPAYLNKQLKVKEQLSELESEQTKLLESRAKLSCKIKIGDMDHQVRYNKLDTESKRFQNIIKMICYRAETAFATLLSTAYKKSVNEKRALVKAIINAHADILPDYTNNTLTVKIYSQSTPRANKALASVIELINQTETQYPGTNLVLNYQIAT